MSKAPAFQFYANDYLAGRVATYNLDEIGAYSLLLAFDWTLSGLPVELEKLARLCRISLRKFKVIWATINEQFVERDGRMFNPRLELERQKSADFAASRSRNGKLGGRPKKSTGLSNGKHPESSPPPSPPPTTSPKPPTGKLTATLDERRVLDHYVATHPRRRAGESQLKIVRKALVEGYSPEDLIEAIDGNAADEWCQKVKKLDLGWALHPKNIDNFRDKARASDEPMVDPVTGALTSAGMVAAGLDR